MTWIPKRTLAETDALLCAPGTLYETETQLVDGRVQRVYKNVWPSLRAFWLWAADQHRERPYLVFENTRLTFAEALDRSLKIAAVFREEYNVEKGDRIAICSRNYPDYLVTFWACQLIGAVSVLVNAWLPLEPLSHCMAATKCKIVIVDGQRADMLEGHTQSILAKVGNAHFLVWEPQEGRGKWNGIGIWEGVLANYRGDPKQVLVHKFNIGPEDDATIMFTSGTTGMPKGVVSTHRMILTNVINVTVASQRSIYRRGETPPVPSSNEPQKGVLIPVPFFHVTGLQGLAMLGTIGGFKIALIRKWVPEEAARLIRDGNISIAGGVPSMVSDLVSSSASGHKMDALLFGGAAPPDWLARDAKVAFPTATMSQGYGLTETNSVAVGIAGEDYSTRTTCAGLPSPVNDLLIVKDGKGMPLGELGEVWIRGPNVMKGYWGDEAGTDKALTRDGWLKTGDVGFLDHEGFLYIRDRIKDLIIRGGENIASITVENAVSADSRLLEVAAVGIPDRRLGELVAVVASVKPAFHGKVKEEEVIRIAIDRLPKFAVPVMIVLQSEPLPRNAPGKILKNELRVVAQKEWERRNEQHVKSKL
ncbi:hypothetical protein OF83DRAFT_1129427 [Amylostereum chailletii]|nr:hypothetical protein OF83DRAFT_1129427 [Amylostereum chailletii]